MNRTAWTVWVVSTVTTFAVLESRGVRSKRAFSEGPFSEGASQKGPSWGVGPIEAPPTGTPYTEPLYGYPTLTACLRLWLGIYPQRGRARVCRPVFTALLAWFFAHIMYGIPWPFEREVMQRVSEQVRRQKW